MSSSTNTSTVVGVFPSRSQAEKAVSELRAAGFADNTIGMVAKNDEGKVEKTDGAGDTMAGEGLMAGAVAGLGVGGLVGLGVLAGVIPVVGPALVAGTLGTILTNAAGGAAIAGVVGALVGFGIPEEDAKYYESEVQGGRFLVTCKADTRHDEAWRILHGQGGYNRANPAATAHGAANQYATAGATGGRAATAGGQTMQLKEERLNVNKTSEKTGDVTVRKEVHTEHRQITVPVEREEVVIERRPVAGQHAAGSIDARAEEIRIPVKEERVHVSKEAVVTEEVSIGKRKVTDQETVSADVRKETVKVEEKGDVNVRNKK